MLLLNCSKSYCQSDSISQYPYGDTIDVQVLIPISYIRKANVELTKYNYLKQIDAQKDSIINSYKLMTIDYDKVSYDLHKEQQKTKLYKFTSIVCLIGCALVAIFK